MAERLTQPVHQSGKRFRQVAWRFGKYLRNNFTAGNAARPILEEKREKFELFRGKFSQRCPVPDYPLPFMVQDQVGGLWLARLAHTAQLPLYRGQSRLVPVSFQHEGISLAAIIAVGDLLLIAAQYHYRGFTELRAAAHGEADKQGGLVAKVVIEQETIWQVPKNQFYGLRATAGGIHRKTTN